MTDLQALATHLDLPPELASALPSPTREETARRALAARVDDVCQELTRTWLHPALVAAGVPDAHEYRVTLTPIPEHAHDHPQ